MQRVAVARALANRPKVLLADEPTGNLDSATAVEILELISASVKKQGASLLMVTHDLELARTWSDRIVRIHDGRIEQDQTS